VSVMTRKHAANGGPSMRERAARSAQLTMPAAKSASTTLRRGAEDASTTLRRSAEDAAAWARPHVDDAAAWARPRLDEARAWAAPRLERGGVAVQENIAPAISDAMVTAARKLDARPARKSRHWGSVLGVTMMLAAAASAAAAVMLRRRSADDGYIAESAAMTEQPIDPDGGELDIEANGHPNA
jgi:hypothetical protein